jgi:cobalt/nickel transport system permease protein
VLTTLVFIVCVVSFGKYDISGLLPFLVYPLFLVVLGDLPLAYLLRKVILAAPFAVLIGIFNPLFDQDVLFRVGSVEISGGWVSFFSILLRFMMTVGAALILIASTGYHAVCMALEKMGVPQVFVVQLLFLYRYLFVLVDEASRMVRARSLRSFQGKGLGMRVFGSMAGHLLLRTMDRAQRIHLAMLCRGFDGNIRPFHPLKVRAWEVLFLLGWSALFVFMRYYNVPRFVGRLVQGLIS